MRPRELLRSGASLLAAARNQWRDPARLRADQRRRLAEQVAFAARTVPFYRRALGSPAAAGTLLETSGLDRLPLVRRDAIQRHPEDFLSESGDRKRWRHSKTSGSTGRPLVTWFDPDCWRQVKGILKARRLLAWGWRPTKRYVVVDAIDPSELTHHTSVSAMPGERWFGGGRSYLSVFEPPRKHLDYYLRVRPHGIYAFPSYLIELAALWDETMRCTVPLQVVMTSAEWIHPATRRRIEQAFGAPIRDIYGLNEFKEIAWQCPAGIGYHVNMESVLVEITDDRGRAVPDGVPGEVVVTSLTNRAMPLIRYVTGDRAVRLPGRCPCGRGLERLDHVEGRVADYLHVPELGLLSPYELTTAVETHPEVAQYKIRHRTDGVLDVLLVLHPGTDGTIASSVRSTLVRCVAGKLPVEVRQVPAIPRAPSGKARCVEIESRLATAASAVTS
jgi:phenylacetate-CoA ligase